MLDLGYREIRAYIAAPPPPNPSQSRTVQRLLVTIGDASKSGVDFPLLATVLIASKTGNKAATMNSVVAPKAGFFASLFGSGPTKETLYVCAHGTTTGITGYTNAALFAKDLKAKGLDATTLTKIVLVSCATGGTNIKSGTPVFARELANAMTLRRNSSG